MIKSIFQGVFDGSAAVSVGDFLLCMGCALVAGLILALSYLRRCRCTNSFAVTLALLPAVVSVVIMMVNGNVGAGVAVAGTFSLVRFRSVPGTAREITVIFLAMGAGLIAGMGYLALALVFTLIMCLLTALYSRLDLGISKNAARYKTLTITIPEDLDYTGIFEDIWKEYTKQWVLARVKTTNMGSMFRLTYDIILQDPAREKEMIDRLRCRNGNLEISISRQETVAAEL